MMQTQDNKPAAPLAGMLQRLDGFPAPERRIGYVAPLPINDALPYMFYAAFRERVMLVMQALALRGYDSASAREALAGLDTALAGIVGYGAETIVVGGSVLSFALERPALLARLAAASDKLGVPVTTDMEAATATMRRAGLRTVAVAHRLDGLDTAGLDAYFAAAGFSVVGVVGPTPPGGTAATGEAAICTEVGLAAGRLHPGADAIFFLGGSTVNYPYLAAIQRGTGKPVFNNAMGLLAYAADWIDAHPPKRA